MMLQSYFIDIYDGEHIYINTTTHPMYSLAYATRDAVLGVTDLFRIRALECVNTTIVALVRDEAGTKLFEMKVVLDIF